MEDGTNDSGYEWGRERVVVGEVSILCGDLELGPVIGRMWLVILIVLHACSLLCDSIAVSPVSLRVPQQGCQPINHIV